MTSAFLPMMTGTASDIAERMQREVRALPFALPPTPGDRMSDDAALAKTLSTINAWHTAERARIPMRQRGGLMLGAVVYGRWYLDMLRDYCLPTLLAPENCRALGDACITLYTDAAGESELREIMRPAWMAQLEVDIHVIPAEVLSADSRPFLSLAAAQQLLVTRAARAGMAFHQLAPDHAYSERYMPNLRKLGAVYRNVAHGGLNVDRPPIPALEDYRADALVVPARDLATIGWHHTVMCAMNGTTPERMPDEHYQVWRARDRVMLFNPYPNPAYITAHMCKLLDTPTMTTGTLDCHTKALFRSDVYLPTVDDDMCFVSIDRNTQPAANYTSRDAFLDRMWREIGGDRELLAYYMRPTEMAAAIDKTAPTAADVTMRQHALVSQAVERAKVAA